MEQFDGALDYSSGVCGETIHAKYKPKCGSVVSQKGSTECQMGLRAAQPKLAVTY